MRLSYFTYEFESPQGKAFHNTGLLDLLMAYCKEANIKFKNSFKNGDENLYLVPLGGQLFGFIETRSHEMINKVNRQNLSIDDIYKALNKDEGLGFTSFVYVDGDCLAFGATLLAPRCGGFADFVQALLRQTKGFEQWRFHCMPLLSESTKTDVLKMPFMGKTTLRVEAGNKLFADLKNVFGGNAEDYNDIDGFELVITPKRKKNIKAVVSRVLNAVPNEHVSKWTVAAKREITERAEEFYIAGKGHLADEVATSDVRKAASLDLHLKKKIQANQNLKTKLEEHRKDGRNELQNAQSSSPFTPSLDASSWPVDVASV